MKANKNVYMEHKDHEKKLTVEAEVDEIDQSTREGEFLLKKILV